MLTECKISVAKTAGFCFGVDRAVKIVYNKLDNRNDVVTLGPIIHNRSVVADLEARGCKAVELDEIGEGQTVIIRSHGVPRSVYKKLEELGTEIVDATCPFVERIQLKALEKTQQGMTVLIAGDVTHPEVEGIRGFCENESYVFAGPGELEELLGRIGSDVRLCVLSQTTYNKLLWEQCREVLAKLRPDAEVYDTICNATAQRQAEAEQLSQHADLMIIAGGRNSSNTHKLVQVCSRYCRTIHVETADELKEALKGEDLTRARSIGISAGASTPAYIIEEVQQAMSEMLNNVEEFNFAEEMEKTLKKIHKGMKVEGIVTAIDANGEVSVDIGTKHTGYIKPEELTDDPSKKPQDIVAVGDTIALIVLFMNQSFLRRKPGFCYSFQE